LDYRRGIHLSRLPHGDFGSNSCRAQLTFAAAQDHDLIGSQDPYFTLTLSGDEVTTKVSDTVSYDSDALSVAGACVLRDRNCPLLASMETWVDHMHC